MDQKYIERINEINRQLDIWLPDLTDMSGINGQWPDGVFPELGNKISGESLKLLYTPLKDLLSRGGKRWRPLLMTLVCELFGGGKAALPLTPLVEFSHNASMIHDDIEDDSDERRGKPSIHKAYGIDTAVNSGSFLYFLSLCCAENCAAEKKSRIYKYWAECMRRLHLGQAMDINWHRNVTFIPDAGEYFMMCAMKTGSLARLAAELGASIAGAQEKAVQLTGEAAEKLGIGFQILDDVINLTKGFPGKKKGSDIVEGKKSLPVILYLHKNPEKKNFIFYCFQTAKMEGSAAPEVEEMIEVMSNAGVLAEAEEKGRYFIKEAREIFTSVQCAGCPTTEEGRALLDGFITLISQE